jgi:CelD/BcsL family acetyltransferase involved in cellulose biosynthesis
VREVDFGTGDDPYKRDWMESTRTRWQVAFYRPLAPRRWPAIAKALVRGGRNAPCSGLPRWLDAAKTMISGKVR